MTAPTPRRPRLAYVSQWYGPEPFPVPEWTAQGLADRGWEVTALTGIPNYPDGVVQPGYAAWRSTVERRGDVRVVRSPLYPSHDRSTVRRALNYLSWALTASVVGLPRLLRSDLSYVYASPATAALPSMLARLLGHRYVLSVQDVWPDSVFASGFLPRTGVGRLAEAVLTRFVDLSYRWAERVVVISPGMVELLVGRGVPPDKIDLVYNWVDEAVVGPTAPDPAFRARLGLPTDAFVLGYAGNHGGAQQLSTAVEAFALLPPTSRAHLVLIGDGVDKPALRVAARGLDRVHFVDPLPPSAAAAAVAACDLALVSLADDPLFAVTLPSKVQALLAQGRPVLVAAAGDAARLVTEADAGFAVAPGDPAALARAVTAAAALPPEQLRRQGENGRRRYATTMAAAVGTATLDRLLRGAAPPVAGSVPTDERSAEPGRPRVGAR